VSGEQGARRLCGAMVWRCPQCQKSVVKALVRKGKRCPRPGCENAGEPFESTCTNRIREGRTRCYQHGGNAPQVMAATRRRQTLAKAQRRGGFGQLLEAAGVELDGRHPIDGLLEAVDRSGRMVGALAVLVAGLEVGDVWGPDHLGDAETHVVVGEYRQWLEVHARCCKLALDAGIDERRTKVAEAEAGRLFQAVTAALPAIPAKEDRDAFCRALAGQLRAGGAGSVSAAS